MKHEHEYEDEADQSQPQQSSSSGHCLLIVLLLVLLVGAILAILAQLAAVGSGNQCDAASFALQIAQKAYQTRKNHTPTGHDFGGGIIVVQYVDGSAPSIYPSPIYEGYDSPPPDVNATHSERRTQDDFILPTLILLQQHGIVAKASEIQVILFTQFSPCPLCRSEMRSWQKQDRQAAGTAKVSMTVWTLRKSFRPLDRNPQQRAQPMVTDKSDLQQVLITFDALSPLSLSGGQVNKVDIGTVVLLPWKRQSCSGYQGGPL